MPSGCSRGKPSRLDSSDRNHRNHGPESGVKVGIELLNQVTVMNSLAEFPGIAIRLFLLFVVLLGLETLVAASPSHAAEYELPASETAVRERLRDRKGEVRAWTIYHIGKEKRGAFLPDLIGFLDLDRFSRFEAQLALDALFKLEVFVPDDVLLKLVNDFPDKVAILLAFQPERHGKAILEMFERHAGIETLEHHLRAALAANLALKAGTPGFAKALIERRLKGGESLVAADLVIRRRFEEEKRIPTGGLGCGCWPVCVPLRQEETFPPVYRTVFSDWPLTKSFVEGPGHVVVNNLECPTESTPSFAVRGFSSGGDDPPVFRSVASGGMVSCETFFDRYASGLVGETVSIRKKETFIWTGRRAFARQVEKARTDGEANFRRIVNRLVERGFLTQIEADNFKPLFVVRISNPDGLRLPQLPGTVSIIPK